MTRCDPTDPAKPGCNSLTFVFFFFTITTPFLNFFLKKIDSVKIRNPDFKNYAKFLKKSKIIFLLKNKTHDLNELRI
jgi:hypothetical protein